MRAVLCLSLLLGELASGAIISMMSGALFPKQQWQLIYCTPSKIRCAQLPVKFHVAEMKKCPLASKQSFTLCTGLGKYYELTLPLVMHNNYCLDSKCVYWVYQKISTSYTFRFGEISRNYWWLRTLNVVASVQLLWISPIENHKLEKPLWVVLRGSCFIISLKLCFWLLVSGLPKFKCLEVWELLDLQGNNGKEVILRLISLHM